MKSRTALLINITLSLQLETGYLKKSIEQMPLFGETVSGLIKRKAVSQETPRQERHLETHGPSWQVVGLHVFLHNMRPVERKSVRSARRKSLNGIGAGA